MPKQTANFIEIRLLVSLVYFRVTYDSLLVLEDRFVLVQDAGDLLTAFLLEVLIGLASARWRPAVENNHNCVVSVYPLGSDKPI